MKRFIIVLVVVLLSVLQLAVASDKERYASTDWNAFSENLVAALASDNDGLRQAAMQHIVTYSKYLDVNDAVFDLVRIYRYHDNAKVRQLAVVAIHHTGNDWAIGFMKRNLRFEDDPVIKRQILECVHQKESGTFASR